MKISYNWLKDYLNTNLHYQEISEILTNIGLEVEGVEEVETIKGGLEGVVIGEVKTCGKHPDADRLSITTVDIGSSELLNIVCGAPNVAAGQKVVVATIGTTLHKGDESFTIKKSKIRGQLSEGMICAEDEIGLGTSHDGIMVLDPSAKTGMPAKEYFNISSDVVFEIGLTPNRIDSGSHYGVARDLAAYLNMEAKVSLTKPDVSAFRIDNDLRAFSVEIESPGLCPRYSGLYIKDVKVGPSPEWLQNKLKAIGLSPINNIVDITNFILHELCQPMHAFDAAKLRGNKIVVKTLAGASKFTTLDGATHEIDSEDLMICDAEKPVALAGIFGGLESGVSENTKDIFLESAYFNPVTVRKTAKKLGIGTDSSFRFERGTDPENTVYAIKRAALLIKELAGGTINSDIIDAYPVVLKPNTVVVTYANIDRLIGKKLPKETIKKILLNLEMGIVLEDNDSLQLSVPLYRVDVTREADVIEEILRIYGYNNVEIPNHVNSTLTYTPHPNFESYTNKISDLLSSNGFAEIMCNSITKSAYYKDLQTIAENQLVKIVNPLSSDLDCMRYSLLFGMLETILHNVNRQNPNLMMYEFGNCYFQDASKKEHPLDKYREERHLAMAMTGFEVEGSWQAPDKAVTFFSLKQKVEWVFTKMGLYNVQFEPADNDLFLYGMKVYRGNIAFGFLGLLAPGVLNRVGIKNEVFYAELDWDKVVLAVKDNSPGFEELPKFPEVRRDLSLLLDKNIAYEKIRELAFRTEKKLLKEVGLFDVFEGEKIGKDKKSYAVSFVLQDNTATLKDKQIDQIMQKLIHVYEKELNATIR
jgi:phenylalanyl-tRNA synthetase beta chain